LRRRLAEGGLCAAAAGGVQARAGDADHAVAADRAQRDPEQPVRLAVLGQAQSPGAAARRERALLAALDAHVDTPARRAAAFELVPSEPAAARELEGPFERGARRQLELATPGVDLGRWPRRAVRLADPQVIPADRRSSPGFVENVSRGSPPARDRGRSRG
jgi:hypothetical protein